jgi:hypothetical protein
MSEKKQNKAQDLMSMPIGEASITANKKSLKYEDNIEICDEILDETLKYCLNWGVDGNRVIVLTHLGRVWFRVDGDVVYVMFVPGWSALFTVQFTVKKKILEPLSRYLQENISLKVSYRSIFMGELVPSNDTREMYIGLVRFMDVTKGYSGINCYIGPYD